MQLFGSYTSPYVRHCRIVLAQTGLQCDFVETDYSQSAEQSPAMRVPFLRDGDLLLTDSASIVRTFREKAGQAFCADIRDYDLFLLVNTAMDSTVNLFLLERDGLTPANSPYLERQRQRIDATLVHLDGQIDATAVDLTSDGVLRLGCFLSWALFRERISLERHCSLSALLDRLDTDPGFAQTHPSRDT
ncbi:MAG: glutathione S-transferase [Wenzhouxiangellaceae bacterium]|nr:glutathione S-transferase [Wenzhouxiangellaceae bacterium]